MEFLKKCVISFLNWVSHKARAEIVEKESTDEIAKG